jgi:ribosomal protein S15P/S13E
MKICRRLMILQLLILPRLINAAQVTLSASTLTATIAEHVGLRLIVRSLENIDEIKVSVPAGDYEIIRRQSQPLIKTAEWRTFEQVITIAFFKTGDFTVGPMDIELLSAKTVKEKEQSDTVNIKIRSLLSENDKDIKPLKKLLAIKGNPLHLLKYLAGAGLILLLIVILLILKRKMKKNSLPVTTYLPAPEIELELRIRELWQQKLPQKGEYKLFFILLGEIIKHFLARTYSFNAVDFTTTEINAHLKNNEKDSDIVICLEDIFQQADLVKFAKRIPETTVISALAEKIATLTGKYKKRRSLTEANHVQTSR